MTRTANNPFGQPSLEDLMVRFLASRSDAAATAVESTGEGDVEPHEVASGFRVDPSAAWNDATCQPSAATVTPPPEWSGLVNLPSPAFAVPMAIGNFPQRVRDLHPLVAKFDPAALRPSEPPLPLPGFSALRAWIEKQTTTHPQLAAGLARVLGDLGAADRLLTAQDAATANERAAVLWQRGRCEEALSAWLTLPDSPAALFNRGMALLFLDRLAEAREALTKVIDALPEASGWNALARLYLAVAEIYG